MPRQADHPRLAGRPRRADPHALDGRSLRDQQPHRARAPGNLRRRTRKPGSRCCAMPAPSSWAASPAKAWATTAPGRTTCCRLRAPRASLAAGRLRLRQAQQPDRGQRGRRAALGPVAAELAYGEGLQAHARAAELRMRGAPLPLARRWQPSACAPVDAGQRQCAARSCEVRAGQRQLRRAGGHRSLAQARPTSRPAGRLALYDGETGRSALMLLYDAPAGQGASRPSSCTSGACWSMPATSGCGIGRQAMRGSSTKPRRLGAATSVGLSHGQAAGPCRAVLSRSWASPTPARVDDGEHEDGAATGAA